MKFKKMSLFSCFIHFLTDLVWIVFWIKLQFHRFDLLLRGLFIRNRASDIGDWKKVGHMIKGITFLLVHPILTNPDKTRKTFVCFHFSQIVYTYFLIWM